MRIAFFLIGLGCLWATSTLVAKEWQAELQELLLRDGLQQENELIQKLMKEEPKLDDIFKVLEKKPPMKKDSGHHLRKIKCSDGVERPYCLFVPDGDDNESAPLFVYLHGGVTRSDLISTPLEYA